MPERVNGNVGPLQKGNRAARLACRAEARTITGAWQRCHVDRKLFGLSLRAFRVMNDAAYPWEKEVEGSLPAAKYT